MPRIILSAVIAFCLIGCAGAPDRGEATQAQTDKARAPAAAAPPPPASSGGGSM